MDVVWVVDAVGVRCGLAPGQVVAGWTIRSGGWGGYAQYVCLPEEDLVPVPAGRALRSGGRLMWFGMAATREHGLAIIPSTLAMRGVLALVPDGRKVPSTPDIGKLGDDWYRTTLAHLLDLLATGQVKPLVADRVPMSEAARAHETLERGGHAGKVVLIPSPA